jgi:hypothetical protein
MRGRSWEMMESAQNRRRRQGVGDDNMLKRSSLARVRVFVWSLCEICPRAALRDDQWVLGEFQTSVDPYSFEGRGSPPLAGLLGSRVPVVTHLVLSSVRGRAAEALFALRPRCLRCLQALYGEGGRRRHIRAVLLMAFDGVLFRAKRCVVC